MIFAQKGAKTLIYPGFFMLFSQNSSGKSWKGKKIVEEKEILCQMPFCKLNFIRFKAVSPSMMRISERFSRVLMIFRGGQVSLCQKLGVGY